MEQKMIASEVFKDKKDNYPQSVPKLFVSTRLSETQMFLYQNSYVERLHSLYIEHYENDFNSMFSLDQMERTSTPRCCRLWAVRR